MGPEGSALGGVRGVKPLAPPVRLTGLHIYPVKGLRGTDLRAAAVEPCGLAGDRRWMVVDEQGHFLTQRQLPAMARFDAALSETTLRLGLDDDAIETPRRPAAGGARIAVTVWRSRLQAATVGGEVDRWLSVRLGRPCRLVQLDDPHARPIEPAHAEPGEHVSFADGFPLLLTSTGSLGALNDGLRAGGGSAIGIDRFRPNLVIDGAAPWAEEEWRLLRIGGIRFRAPKPCVRCVVTSIDQRSGRIAAPGEPLRTLARLRPRPGGILFGLNLVAQQDGRLAVGDRVEILE